MEPNDRRTIKIFRNYDDIKEDFLEGLDDTHQDLGMLEPRLVYLRSFSDYFSTGLGPELDPKIFWGLVGLILTASQFFLKLSKPLSG